MYLYKTELIYKQSNSATNKLITLSQYNEPTHPHVHKIVNLEASELTYAVTTQQQGQKRRGRPPKSTQAIQTTNKQVPESTYKSCLLYIFII